MWDTATCGTDANATVKAIRHAVSVVGVDHVALGSDFDGAVTTPFDSSGWVLVRDALLQEGFSEQEIRKIMEKMWCECCWKRSLVGRNVAPCLLNSTSS